MQIVLVVSNHVPGDFRSDKGQPLESKQCARGQIGPLDDAVLIQCQIPDRCKFIQFGVAISGILQLNLCMAELFVLHLELDLMHLQFMDQGLKVFEW